MSQLPPATIHVGDKTFSGKGQLESGGSNRITGRFDADYSDLNASSERGALEALPGDSPAIFEGEYQGRRIRAPVHVNSVHTDEGKRSHTAVLEVSGPLEPLS